MLFKQETLNKRKPIKYLSKMKRQILIVLTILALLLISGCAGQYVITDKNTGKQYEVALQEVGNGTSAITRQNNTNLIKEPVIQEARKTITAEDWFSSISAPEEQLTKYRAIQNAKTVEDCLKFDTGSITDEGWVSKCFGFLAVNQGDVNICKKSPYPRYVDACIQYGATMLVDISACDLVNPALKATCYSDVAKKDLDSKLEDCDKLGAEYGSCYVAVATNNKDVSICDKVPPSIKDECISGVATAKLDIALCATLIEGRERTGEVSSQTVFNCQWGIMDEKGLKSDTTETKATVNDCEISKTITKRFQGDYVATLDYNVCMNNIALRDLNLDICQDDDCKAKVQHAMEVKG